jgi:anti-sigma28 factor (negative regulator of flagellin synthesis)
MRIDRSNPVTVQPRESAAKPTTPPPTKDVVNLSAAGSAAAEVSSSAPTDRIARIRALVQQGAYPIDLDMLASRIVHDELLRSKGSA